MPTFKFTKGNIDSKAKPKPTGDVLYWDTETRGLGLRVTPKGVTTFICQGRVRGTTKDVRLTVGTYGAWTVDDARRRAEDYRRQFEDGIDPREVKKQREAEQVTLGAIATAYLARPAALKLSTATWITYYVEKVFAKWRDKPIASITRDMVRDRHRELVDGGLHGKKGAPATANAAMVVLRILIGFAADELRLADGKPLITDNPVDALKRHWAPEGDRTHRYIDKRKVGAVWNALHEARNQPISDDQRTGIDLTLFLLLTGARRNEGAALTWDRVNIDHEEPSNSWFFLPDPKSGREVYLPLSKQAVKLLELRKRIDGNPHVFPSRSKAGHIIDPRSPMELVSKVAAVHLSSHDLRRTFTNIALRECLIEKFRTDLLTCHVPSHADTTARHYLDLKKLDWLFPETQRISDWIEEQGRLAAGENIVLLPQRA